MRKRANKKKSRSITGIRKVNVPDLSGLTRFQAKTALESVGLSWSENPSSIENINLDQSIMSQTIPNGTTVRIGQIVSFTYYNYIAPPPSAPPATPPSSPPSQSYPNISSAIAYGAGAGQVWTQTQAYVTWGGSGWGSYTVTASNGSSNNSASSGGGPPVLLSGFNAGTNYSVTVVLYEKANYSGTTASASTSFTTAAASGGGPVEVNCGECVGYVTMSPTCNGQDSYQGYYSAYARTCSDGSTSTAGCPAGGQFQYYGNLITANVTSCGGSGGTLNCTACTGYAGHPAATETFACADGCGTYTICYTQAGCPNYTSSPCPGCPPATPPASPPTTNCSACTGYAGHPAAYETFACADGCGTYTMCYTPMGCSNYISSPCPGCPPATPPASPPATPPAGPPAGPPADPPAAPPSTPPSTPPADPPIFDGNWYGKSVNVSTLVRTPSGLVRADNLNVGDVLLSADLDGFPYNPGEGVTEEALAWTSENTNINFVNTTIVGIRRRVGDKAIIINGDIFSQYHWILVKRDNVIKFVLSENIVENSDYIFDADTNTWEIVDLFEAIEVNHETISIDCEPYDMFFTEKMLTHDSFSI